MREKRIYIVDLSFRQLSLPRFQPALQCVTFSSYYFCRTEHGIYVSYFHKRSFNFTCTDLYFDSSLLPHFKTLITYLAVFTRFYAARRYCRYSNRRHKPAPTSLPACIRCLSDWQVPAEAPPIYCRCCYETTRSNRFLRF